MKPTVSPETASQLEEAGFIPPEIKTGQFWYKTIFEGGTAEHSALCICLNFGGQIVMQAVEPRWDYPGNSGPDKKAFFAPTATDIIKQMPLGTKIQTVILATGENLWECIFDIDNHYDDSRYDECPHEASAKAFLAWKAGLE